MNENDVVHQAFVEAVRHGGEDLRAAALEVGASAAAEGVGLSEVLDRVQVAFGDGTPDVDTIRSVAESWAQHVEFVAFDASCHDPLTALCSVPHLRARLGDLYRRAPHVGTAADDSHILVVVELVRRHRDDLGADLRALEVAELLEAVYPAHEVLARLAPHRFAALVETRHADPMTVALLSRLVARAIPQEPAPRLWVERLPGSADSLGHLLAALVR